MRKKNWNEIFLQEKTLRTQKVWVILGTLPWSSGRAVLLKQTDRKIWENEIGPVGTELRKDSKKYTGSRLLILDTPHELGPASTASYQLKMETVCASLGNGTLHHPVSIGKRLRQVEVIVLARGPITFRGALLPKAS